MLWHCSQVYTHYREFKTSIGPTKSENCSEIVIYGKKKVTYNQPQSINKNVHVYTSGAKADAIDGIGGVGNILCNTPKEGITYHYGVF